MPIIIRHNGALNSAAEGFAAGAPGLAQGLRYQQQQEREDARYRDEVARANEQLRIQQEREKRAADEYKRQVDNENAIKEGQRTLTDYRLGEITPQQTAPWYVKEGGLQQAGGGMMAPSRFAAGLMQHHERVLAHAKDVAAKLPPELHDRFFQDVQRGLEKDQTDAMFAKAQSDIANLGKDLATPEAGGAVQDQLPAVQERSKALMDLLKSSEGADPKQKAQILQTVQQAIHAQRADLIQTAVRRKRMAGITANLGAQNDAARVVASDPSIPPDIAATLHARIDERQALLEMANLDPEMTTDDLMRGWHSAGTVTVPKSVAARGSESPSAAKPEYTYSQALQDARREFGTSTKITADQIRTRAMEFYNQRNARPLPPDSGKVGSENGIPFRTGDPTIDGAPETSAPAPTQPKPVPYSKAPPEAQSTLVDEIKADMAQGGQQIPAIFAKYGVDPESLPPEVLKSLIEAPKKASSKRASKLEHVGPNF